jgi:hypothetical protein
MGRYRLNALLFTYLTLIAGPAAAHGGDHSAFGLTETLRHFALSSGHLLLPASMWVLAAAWCLLAVRRKRARAAVRNQRR